MSIKRNLEDKPLLPKSKKQKLLESEEPSRPRQDKAQPKVASALISEEIDFPRGGGTSFTPLEYKVIQAEARKEADDEVFKETGAAKKHSKEKKIIRSSNISKNKSQDAQNTKDGIIRVEHLNYKRMVVGMKVLCQVVSVRPLDVIVSLPNQLFGHIPITQITTQLTSLLEAMDEDVVRQDGTDDDETDNPGGPSRKDVPDIDEMFHPGDYLRAVVTALRPAGTTENTEFLRSRDIVEKSSRRVELSLIPEQVNAGVSKDDLREGFTITASLKSIEDHGYLLDLGVSGFSGFLPFKDVVNTPGTGSQTLPIGTLLNVRIQNLAKNGRTCTVTSERSVFKQSLMTEVTNVASLLPGTLVQCLVTAVLPTGLNVQVLGFFLGTIDLHHLPSRNTETEFKVGQKIKARILYDVQGTNPPQFSLTLLEHILALDVKGTKPRSASERTQPVQESFAIGTTLDSVKVVGVDTEQGLVVAVEPGIEGYIHISQTSDDHVPSLSPTSGPWKVNTVHRARVTGYHPLDGLLQLSLRPSVLSRRFLKVADVRVGELMSGTVKKLTDAGLFVSIQGNVDGVIWPNHFADIPLKQPSRRFKVGGNVKCRVLAVDAERQRIVLTAKKTLVESELPVLARFEDAKEGMLAHGFISRIFDKSLLVEFYNHTKAIVSAREASDASAENLSMAFAVGKPVKVRILSIDSDSQRLVASIRQAAPGVTGLVGNVSTVEIGQTVTGVVSAIHSGNIVLTLQPSNVRALVSVHNVANHRGVSDDQLRSTLTVGDSLDALVVVSRNLDKGIVIAASRPSGNGSTSKKDPPNVESLQVGQIVSGKVASHGHKGATITLSSNFVGLLHPTDCCDDYSSGIPFPAVDSTIKAVILDIDRRTKRVTLSSRLSRMEPATTVPVIDREITFVENLQVGNEVRGFVKSVAEHGVFVSVGRNVDVRVQIKEIYDQYVKDWKKGVEVNKLVTGRILSVNSEKKQAEMTFRSPSAQTSPSTPMLTFKDLSVGLKVEGRVKKVEDFGIFVAINNSKLTGLCHKSEIADNKQADVNIALRSFKEGDTVKAVILAIDADRRRISLGLKPSYFGDADFTDDNDDVDESPSQKSEENEPNDGHCGDTTMAVEEPSEDSDENVELEPNTVTAFARNSNIAVSTQNPHASSIKIQGGFQWTNHDVQEADDDNADHFSSEEEEEGEQIDKRKRKRKKQIEQDLTADMHTAMPESTADFERHLLGSPNSSYMWIQYMSFQLQLSEIDKAREVGKRALRTINFREEREKLNVWIALLNLENTYGTAESLEATFKDAARHNDSKTIHLRLATILDQSEKHQNAEEQYKRTCKKFGQSSKVWTLFGEHYLRRGQLEEARALLPRSLKSLDKRKHLKTISKFAQMEYRLGGPERGKTIFEGIVDSHPKRWDLWSIYMDMEAAQKDIQSLRNLFDRVLAKKMTSHKAKFFFKKWLDLEHRIGDEMGASLVKKKAVEWTQRAAGTPL
ncbi:nucleic acid-binding protein [Rickenella mellea]|uniref:Nucleic acid-binding protein n=1 Tax=Rickenella mellea TaxID=50990 RepID=A0A4Y7QLT5_9AGAM|nr:nucleic acid-binding protein [Rickenella mellea]